MPRSRAYSNRADPCDRRVAYLRPVSIARVEPLTTARALRGPFDYLIPERLGEVEVGTVLEVPFGRRRITGVVVEITETTDVPPEKMAEPIRVLGEGTSADLIDLGRWIAAEYCSTPARGLGLVLPPGTGTGGERTRFRVEKLSSITEAGREALDGGVRLGAKQQLALQQLLEGDLTGRQLAARAGVDSTTLKRLEDRGLIERRQVNVRRRPGRGRSRRGGDPRTRTDRSPGGGGCRPLVEAG